jgi:hypothetical protein
MNFGQFELFELFKLNRGAIDKCGPAPTASFGLTQQLGWSRQGWQPTHVVGGLPHGARGCSGRPHPVIPSDKGSWEGWLEVDGGVGNPFEGFGEEKAHRKVACDNISGGAEVHAGVVLEEWSRPALKWTSRFSGPGCCSRRWRWAGGWTEPGCPHGGACAAGWTVGKRVLWTNSGCGVGSRHSMHAEDDVGTRGQ